MTQKLTRMMHCSWWGQQLSYASSVYKKWSPSLHHSHQNALQPLLQKVIGFITVILQGPSILQADANSDDRMGLDARMQIAATISQLLIYNTCSGTHHARQTSTIRHGKDQETTFPLYQGLTMHREAWLKNRSRLHMHLVCQCLTVMSWK